MGSNGAQKQVARVKVSKDPYERADQMKSLLDDIAVQQKWNPTQSISLDFSFYLVLTTTISELAQEQLAMKDLLADIAAKVGVTVLEPETKEELAIET